MTNNLPRNRKRRLKRLEKQEDKQPLTILFPADLYNWLQEQSVRRYTTKSAYIRDLLLERKEEMEQKLEERKAKLGTHEKPSESEDK
jgi:hypothetical protein